VRYGRAELAAEISALTEAGLEDLDEPSSASRRARSRAEEPSRES
jgi:hypothetical protein